MIAAGGLLTGGNLAVAAVGASTVAGVVTAYGLVRLTAALPPAFTPGGSRRVGPLLVALFAAVPLGIVLSMAYTEALFCALAAWALVGTLREQWLLAALCACAAGLVRPTGILLALVVAVAALVAAARGSSRRPLLAAVLAPAGLLGYLTYVGWQTGSSGGWFEIQRGGWRSEIDGGAGMLRYVGHVLTFGGGAYQFAVLLALAGSIALLVIAVRMRLPWPLLAYSAAVVATVWASGGLMESHVRLLIPEFPLLIPIAVGLARRRTGTIVAVMVATVLASAWFGGYALTIWPHAI